MKWYTITKLASILHISKDEAFKRMSDVGIIGGYPESHFITEEGQKYAKDQWVERDRYGRSYSTQIFSSAVIELIKNTNNK